MYVHSQNRYMHTVVIHTITRDSRMASPFEMFFVSFPNTIGHTTEAMIPKIAKTTVPVIIPGAANPYEFMAIIYGSYKMRCVQNIWAHNASLINIY